jgi:membrane-associated phospholipid phosphatase
MNELVHWGLGIVQWIQTFRNPLFDQFFLTINFLGNEEFYLSFLPLLFWCIHKPLGIRLGVLFLFSFFTNQWLKDLFAAPRPYQIDSKLYAPVQQAGYGIPSGHAQRTATTWGYIATQFQRPLWWALAVAIPLLLSIGRMYLGNHFPQDVVAGLVLGLIFVAVYAAIEPAASAWLRRNRSQSNSHSRSSLRLRSPCCT